MDRLRRGTGGSGSGTIFKLKDEGKSESVGWKEWNLREGGKLRRKFYLRKKQRIRPTDTILDEKGSAR